MTSAADLRELPDDELRQELAANKEELFNLRFQNVTGALDDPRRIKTVKREIARILTVMREREIAEELAAAETDAEVNQ
ncbi:MAG: 50S ribosomal protein L29 [Nitriliruptorales bacterium]|nr:50S ribosomal protein L29 [Nitriliruptorales bacterium]